MVHSLKKEAVQSLSDLIEKNSNIAFVSFKKTTHQALETLRKDLKKSKAKMKVMKNSLLEKAIGKLVDKNKLFADLKKTYFPLKDSTAILLLSDDWGAGVKAFYQFSEKDKTLSFKLALLDHVLYSQEETKRIATLPSREELIAKIIGQTKSPLTKLTYVMKFHMQKITYILSEKSKQVAS